MDNYHLTKSKGKWKFRKEKAERSIRNFDTKDEAMEYAVAFMNKKNRVGSLKIHKESGEIQEERTYPRSMDPKETAG